ncbi:MAG: rhomboid family intramembrane serine protease, partial [Pseudomonadota bacterium]
YSFLNLFPDALTWPVLVRLTFFYGSLTDLFSAGFDRSVFWNISSLFTHGLVHLLAIHLMVNLGFLLAFGSAVERAIGPRGMLTVFFVSVAAGAIAQLLLDPSTSGALMGASGGVSGCMGCFARLLLRSGTPRRMRRMGFNLIGVLIAMNLAIGVFGDAIFGGALGDAQVRIAWQAHIGGFVAGLLLGSLPWPIPHRRGLWRSH